MKTVRRSFLVIVCFGMACGGLARAADVTWGSPTLTTGQASDVLTIGSLVEASSNNPSSPTVNGVLFTDLDPGIPFSGFNLNYTGHAYTPSTWVSPDPGMVALVGGSAWGAGANSLTLDDLVAGKNYIVQIFMPAWDHNWETNFTGGSNTSQFVYPAGAAGTGPANPTPEYIVGSFTATGSSQSITPSGLGGNSDEVAAVQVRELAVPEPATWALMSLGFGGLGMALRSRPRADPVHA